MDVVDIKNPLRLVLDGKSASMSVLAHHGTSADNTQFATGAQDMWEVWLFNPYEP